MAFDADDIADSFTEAQSPRGVRVSNVGRAFHNAGNSARSVPVNVGFSVSARTSDVAGDGFLYDEARGVGGRWSDEQRALFVAALKQLFEAGMSNRATARVLGISPNTVSGYRRKLQDSVKSCACGQDARHQGWCRVRFRASKPRQVFMRGWHPSASWPYQPKDGFQIAWAERQAEL